MVRQHQQVFYLELSYFARRNAATWCPMIPRTSALAAVVITTSTLGMISSPTATGMAARSSVQQSAANQRERKYVHVNADGDLDIAYPANLETPAFATDPGPLVTMHFVRRIHTDPRPTVSVRRLEDRAFEYRYVVENGNAGFQPITNWRLVVSSAEFVDARSEPNGWVHVRNPFPTPPDPRAPYYLDPPGYFVEWVTRSDAEGRGPGAIQSGERGEFAVRSRARPGFIRSFFASGFQEDPTRDMPQSVADEFYWFKTIAGEMQARTVLGPAYADAVGPRALAVALRESVTSLISAKQLAADAPFVLEAIDLLERVARAQNAGNVRVEFHTEPANELERQLQLAIEIDCGVSRP